MGRRGGKGEFELFLLRAAAAEAGRPRFYTGGMCGERGAGETGACTRTHYCGGP